jgi:competence protein ComEC
LVFILTFIYDKSSVVLLFFCLCIAAFGVFRNVDQPLPDNVFKVGRVLSNSQTKFKFISSRKPKKIFEIRKSNYKEGNLYVGDLIFWNKGFDSISPPKQLDGFIYADYLKGIGVNGIIKISGFPSKVGKERWSVFKLATQFKTSIISELLKVEELSEKNNGVLIALLTGDRSFLSKSTKTMFRDAGVVHVLAISGMHVGVLYLLFVFVFKNVLRFKGKSALILIGSGIVFYAFLSGLSPSVIRATIMLLLIQFGTLLNSKVDTLNLVVSACWMMLVYEPLWIYDIGFQLSFSAVIGIIIFLNRFKTWGLKGSFSFITDLLKVNTGAFVFTVPILSYHFKLINFTSWWASFVIVPFISLLMYGGILGLMILKISVLKKFIFVGLNYFINFVELMVSYVVDHSSCQLYWQCSFLELLFYYLLVFGSMLSKRVLLFSGFCLLIFSVFLRPPKEVRLLNCKQSIQIKVDNSCFSLEKGDLLQFNNYFFSRNNDKDDCCKVSIYRGYSGFSGVNIKIQTLTVDNYHILKLKY